MSYEVSSARMDSRNAARSSQPFEENENAVRKLSTPAHFPPPRSPLNAIPDPSQAQLENAYDTHKLDSAHTHQVFDEKSEPTDKGLRVCKSAAEGPSSITPKVSAGVKVHSDPNLAQGTPARTAWKNMNVAGGSGGFRSNQYSAGRLGSSSKASRSFAIVNAEARVDVPHFELQEDPLFWKDHNVQVLIRIRPLSNIERVSQGYTRCLRQDNAQTLTWLGHPDTRFTFDHIAGETITQEKLFRVAGLPMVENCMSGYNSCIFAYGQTGSGKTYTMMGEIQGTEGRLGGDSGITPRLFEYLFARIKSEEESRREEKLTYSCKCSFLEIYNEHITDLLEPSSSNLQLREDMKKGVYVENLTEHNVRTVNDVLQLLLKGAANRKIAATYMNSESSRSHSVFTCIIESCWERDSMKHIRFGRLNLVDLAGSERQKSSCAEGDRLKEAANINRSLSTLGLVIMSLVDMAHGKHRHVPYRDSRLTFLLQDSLGGNSKTTIIANVSPSICSSNETLSTLKFAQRAKLIQNNAKVNEDASDDVPALQQQIEELKGQLSYFMKQQTFLSSLSPTYYNDRLGHRDFSKHTNTWEQENVNDRINGRNGKSELITFETSITGTCKSEKVAMTTTRRLEAEVEHLKRLSLEREDEVQKRIMMIQLQEEKIRTLKLHVNGSLSGDQYLVEENKVLLEENQRLCIRVSRSEELAKAALKNIRFLEQAKGFCDRIEELCEESRHETLLEEVSKFHFQLSERLVETCGNFHSSLRDGKQGDEMIEELGGCRNMNLLHHSAAEEEGHDIRTKVMNSSFRELALNQSDRISIVETMSMRSDMGYESMSCDQVDEYVLPSEVHLNIEGSSISNHVETGNGMEDASILIEALESEQVHLLEELKYMQKENCKLTNMISMGDTEKNANFIFDNHDFVNGKFYNGNRGAILSNESTREVNLQFKLDKMTHELKEATVLNRQYREDQASQLCQQKEVELVRQHVEMETAETMLNLQEEMAALQTELNDKLCYLTAENLELRNNIAAKDDELKDLSVKWERAIFELTNFLVDGTKSLKDASSHIDSIACLFPDISLCVSGLVERAAKVCVDKDERMLMLQRSLEHAQRVSLEMEQKLSSLKGATIALTQVKQPEKYECVEQPIHPMLIFDKAMKVLQSKLRDIDDQFCELEKNAIVSFLAMKRLSHSPDSENDSNRDIDSIEFGTSSQMANQLLCNELKSKVLAGDGTDEFNITRLDELELENAFCSSFVDEGKPSSCQTDLQKACLWSQKLVKGLIKGVHDLREKFKELKEERSYSELGDFKMPSVEPLQGITLDNQCHMLCQIRDGVSETNKSLASLQAALDGIFEHRIAEDPYQSDGWSADSSTTDSITSSSDAPQDMIMKATSASGSTAFSVNMIEEKLGKDCSLCLTQPFHALEAREVDWFSEFSIKNDERILSLQKEFQMAFEGFSKLQTWLAALSNEKDAAESIFVPECCMTGKSYQVSRSRKGQHQIEMSKKTQMLSSSEASMEETDFAGKSIQELTDDGKTKQTGCFFANFEAAEATIEEADFMLQALLKAKEDAQKLTEMWKQAGTEMKEERDGLLQQVLQLQSMLCMTGGDEEVTGDKKNYGLKVVARKFISLEDCFSDSQREVQDGLNKFHFDVLSIMEETQYCICCMRSLLESLCSEVMATDFASVVFCKSVEDCLRGLQNFNKHDSASTIKWQELLSEMGDEGAASTSAQNIEQRKLRSDFTEPENQLHPMTNNICSENLQLRKELERKEELLKGLLFDLSLLQESISDRKDTGDEAQQLVLASGQLKQQIGDKKAQLDDTMACCRKLEKCLSVSENNLYIANYELEQIQRSFTSVSDEKVKLQLQMKDRDEELQEQKEVIKGLEKVVLQLTSSTDEKISESLAEVEADLRRVIRERDQLQEEIRSLNEKSELARTLAEENEAVAIEARQDAETSKIYAQQKEEEVKILEHSIEELERTVNVLENKVHDMEEEVLRNRLSRNSMEQEVQSVRQRLLTVENLTSENIVEGQIPEQLTSSDRFLDLNKAHNKITILGNIRGQQAKEIARLKEYISELVLHSEAQASQYQRKYKALEELVHDLQKDPSTLASTTSISSKSERSLSRTRGSSSPFRCISNLVQQMNIEKDQELSIARHRIAELETIAGNRQREVKRKQKWSRINAYSSTANATKVCMLNSRLAAAESMTHDVIRDLLGVKLDMTNYANLIDQQQLQRLLDVAQRQTLDSVSKDHEIGILRKQVHNLVQEKESCASERHKKEADILAIHLTLEQLKERDQFLTVQNEMLKVEKTNLTARLAELERMAKTHERQNVTQCSHSNRAKEKHFQV